MQGVVCVWVAMALGYRRQELDTHRCHGNLKIQTIHESIQMYQIESVLERKSRYIIYSYPVSTFFTTG